MIERRKPLKRTALKRPTMAQVQAFQRKARKRIPKVGAKGKREAAKVAAFSDAVRAHAQTWCEANGGRETCGTQAAHRGSSAHHVWPEDRDAGRHEPRRGLWLCFRAHRWVHDHPTRAAELGLLRPTER